jgi:tetratricopeptide (TPR) repeat protein
MTALNMNPADEVSLARLGKQALIRGNYSQALDYYASIVNKEPRPYHEYAYLDVGLIYWKGGTLVAFELGLMILGFLSHEVNSLLA